MPYYGGDPQYADPRALISRLMARGYSQMQAAAIVGNMQRESGLATNNVNKGEGAYGLMQWRGDRFQNLQQFAADQGKPWTDPSVQTDFVAHEMGGTERGNVGGFYGARTIDDATAALHPYIRYDLNVPNNLLDRQNFARQHYASSGDNPALAATTLPAQAQGQRPDVSRETQAYQRGLAAGYDPYDMRNAKGLRGGFASLGDIGAAYINKNYPGGSLFSSVGVGARPDGSIPQPAQDVPLPRPRPPDLGQKPIMGDALPPVAANDPTLLNPDDRLGSVVDPTQYSDYG